MPDRWRSWATARRTRAKWPEWPRRRPTTCAVTAAQSDDPLAAIMAAPVVRCDVVQFELFGISLAGWNFLLSTLGALLVLGLIGRANAAS